MESQLRKLGLKFKLHDAKFYVLEDFIVCEEGKALSPEQSQMCRLLDIRQDEFRINIIGYNTKLGEFKKFNNETFDSDGNDEGEDDEEMN